MSLIEFRAFHWWSALEWLQSPEASYTVHWDIFFISLLIPFYTHSRLTILQSLKFQIARISSFPLMISRQKRGFFFLSLFKTFQIKGPVLYLVHSIFCTFQVEHILFFFIFHFLYSLFSVNSIFFHIPNWANSKFSKF